MTTVAGRESQAHLDEQATDTQRRPPLTQSQVQDAIAQAKETTPEHAKALVKYPTPLWMIEHDPKGAGNYETFWADWRNVSLLLDHYLPGTLVDSEVIHATDDDVSHVKVTLTAMNPDGTIARRVSAISGQRNTNKGGRDAFAEAKAQSYAFKNAAIMLGICTDLSILLANEAVKNDVRKHKYRNQVYGQGRNASPTSRSVSNPASHSQPTTGADARSTPKKATSATQPPASQQPTDNQPTGNQPAGNQPSSRVHSGNREGLDQKGLDQKRNRLRYLSQQMGISEEGMHKRISDSYNKRLEELPESDLDHLINASLKHLSKKA